MNISIGDISEIVLMSEDALGPRTNWLLVYRKDGTTTNIGGKKSIAQFVQHLEQENPSLASRIRTALSEPRDVDASFTLYRDVVAGDRKG